MYLYQNAFHVVINIVLFNIHTSCTIFNWCINSVLQVCCLWQSPWNCWWLRGAKCQQWNDWHMQLKMRVRKCLLLDFGWFHANSIILMITMHFASRNPTDKVKCDLLRMRTVSLGGRVDIVKKEREPSLLPIGMCYCPVTRAQADEDFFHHRLWCDAVMMIGFPPPTVRVDLLRVPALPLRSLLLNVSRSRPGPSPEQRWLLKMYIYQTQNLSVALITTLVHDDVESSYRIYIWTIGIY